MPALTAPTPTEVISSLSIGGEAGYFGRWNAELLTDFIAGSLFDPITEEYDYHSSILTAAGLNPASLTNDQHKTALLGLLHAIAYRLLDLDWNNTTQIPAEPNDAMHGKHYQRQMAMHYNRAGLAYFELGCTSKYYQSPTIGFATTGFASNNPETLFELESPTL